MYIINLTYKVTLDVVEKHLEPHVAYLKDQYAKGSFIASGRKDPRNGGVILSKMKDLDALKAVVAEDPFYKEGVADYDIICFEPSMVAEGYENLK